MLKHVGSDFRFKAINCLWADLGSKTIASVRCDAHPIQSQDGLQNNPSIPKCKPEAACRRSSPPL